MTVTVPLVLLFLVVGIALLKLKKVGATAAIALFLLGFLAAATGASGPVHRILAAAVHAVGAIHI